MTNDLYSILNNTGVLEVLFEHWEFQDFFTYFSLSFMLFVMHF